VSLWKRHNGNNQRWKITYVDTVKTVHGEGIGTERDATFGFFANRPFYLRSRMPGRRAVEVVGGRNLVLRKIEKDRETQMFFWDSVTKTIKS